MHVPSWSGRPRGGARVGSHSGSLEESRCVAPRYLSLSFFGLAAQAQAATRYVSTTGSDTATCTQTAPCKIVCPRATRSPRRVTPSRWRPGATSPRRWLRHEGRHVQGRHRRDRALAGRRRRTSLDGINIDAANARCWACSSAAPNADFKNASIGNVVDEKGMLATASAWLHDRQRPLPRRAGRHRGHPQRVPVQPGGEHHDQEQPLHELRDDGRVLHARDVVGAAGLRRLDADRTTSSARRASRTAAAATTTPCTGRTSRPSIAPSSVATRTRPR